MSSGNLRWVHIFGYLVEVALSEKMHSQKKQLVYKLLMLNKLTIGYVVSVEVDEAEVQDNCEFIAFCFDLIINLFSLSFLHLVLRLINQTLTWNHKRQDSNRLKVQVEIQLLPVNPLDPILWQT